ncbi:MAG: universal stress protein [Rhodospirillales bacterium]|nr:universal stress protein [Rhodospirillales bacterium]
MRPKDILVVLDGTRQSAVSLRVAVALARRHGARIEGLCPLGLLAARDPPFDVLRGEVTPLGPPSVGGIYAPPIAPPEPAVPAPDSPPERAERIGEAFREELGRSGLDGSYDSAVGRPGEAVAARARKSDLIVLGQPEPGQTAATAHRHMVEDVLLTAGRPVLIVPFAGEFETVGANVLIGWRESPEAARAAHDALALVEAGAKLTLLTVRHGPIPAERTELPGAGMARHLARHGVKTASDEAVAEASTPASFVVRPAVTETDVLLNYASDVGADLLVVGAYGHSRMRELVLGGVTRGLLGHMTLPVLMSH